MNLIVKCYRYFLRLDQLKMQVQVNCIALWNSDTTVCCYFGKCIGHSQNLHMLGTACCRSGTHTTVVCCAEHCVSVCG